MKFIPSIVKVPIERDNGFGFLDEEEHPSVIENKKNEEKHKEILSRIKNNCALLRTVNPQIWNSVESDLMALHGVVHAMDSRSPIEYMGGGIDPAYYAISKAYLCGQKEILESIFNYIHIVKDKNNLSIKPETKTFFIRLLDRLKRLCKFPTKIN